LFGLEEEEKSTSKEFANALKDKDSRYLAILSPYTAIQIPGFHSSSHLYLFTFAFGLTLGLHWAQPRRLRPGELSVRTATA
jgi:hypothetical protein